MNYLPGINEGGNMPGITLSNRLRILHSFENANLIKVLQKKCTLHSPEYQKCIKLGKKPYKKVGDKWVNISPIKVYWKKEGNIASFPWGCIWEVPELTRGSYPKSENIKLYKNLGLRKYQRDAADAMEKLNLGHVVVPTGGGKTVIGCEIIRRQCVSKTLILVHTKELMYQWKERLIQFLDLEEDEICLIGDGLKPKYLHESTVTVGIINTVNNMIKKEELPSYYAQMIICDECHRTPANLFTDVLDYFNAPFRYGFSATPYRADGLGDVISLYLGPVIYEISVKELQEQGYIMKPKLELIPTEFNYETPWDKKIFNEWFRKNNINLYSFKNIFPDLKIDKFSISLSNGIWKLSNSLDMVRKSGNLMDLCKLLKLKYPFKLEYNHLIDCLIKDENRDNVVINCIRDAQKNGGNVLVVADRKEYLEKLILGVYNPQPKTVYLMTSDISSKERKENIKELNSSSDNSIIFATSSLIGEGFDLPSLRSVVLATPIKGVDRSTGNKSPKLTQLIGRILRPAEGKKQPIIYDIVDWECGLLRKHYRSREVIYKELGII